MCIGFARKLPDLLDLPLAEQAGRPHRAQPIRLTPDDIDPDRRRKSRRLIEPRLGRSHDPLAGAFGQDDERLFAA
jgi:hypothetical protein